MKARCSCHPADVYGRCVDCPACGHWSYDPGVGCERRKCAFVETERQGKLLDVAPFRGVEDVQTGTAL